MRKQPSFSLNERHYGRDSRYSQRLVSEEQEVLRAVVSGSGSSSKPLTFGGAGEYGGGKGITNTGKRRGSHVTQRVLPHRALNAGSGQNPRFLRARPGLQAGALRHHQGHGRRADPAHFP